MLGDFSSLIHGSTRQVVFEVVIIIYFYAKSRKKSASFSLSTPKIFIAPREIKLLFLRKKMVMFLPLFLYLSVYLLVIRTPIILKIIRSYNMLLKKKL